jgi:hypothetical protein
LNHAHSISFCIAAQISHTVFHALATLIHAARALLFISIINHPAGFLSYHPMITEMAASVLIHTFLSFIQKSNVTRSQFLNTIHSLALPCTTTLFTLIHILSGNPYTQ